jgi:pimeloyl-ACP methyl ester carboxylesterase
MPSATSPASWPTCGGYASPWSRSTPTPGVTDAAALRCHGVRTVLASGVGHFLMLEDPGGFNRLLGTVVEELRG